MHLGKNATDNIIRFVDKCMVIIIIDMGMKFKIFRHIK